jgi:hypothetical protein
VLFSAFWPVSVTADAGKVIDAGTVDDQTDNVVHPDPSALHNCIAPADIGQIDPKIVASHTSIAEGVICRPQLPVSDAQTRLSTIFSVIGIGMSERRFSPSFFKCV